MQTNQFWRGYIIYALQNNEPVTGALHFNDLLMTVTPQTIQLAAKQYLNNKNYIGLVLMPEPQK
jgi:zinc protease